MVFLRYGVPNTPLFIQIVKLNLVSPIDVLPNSLVRIVSLKRMSYLLLIFLSK